MKHFPNNKKLIHVCFSGLEAHFTGGIVHRPEVHSRHALNPREAHSVMVCKSIVNNILGYIAQFKIRHVSLLF